MFRCRLLAVVSMTPALLFALTSCTGQPGAKYEYDLHVDFRGNSVPADLQLRITPEGSHQFVRPEPEGLRVTLPKDRDDLAPVVMGTPFGLKGDFEITATLEILDADPPADGYGAGATLFINKADRHYEGATLGRLLRPGGKDVVIWDHVLGKPGPDRKFDANTRPWNDKRLRLRLERTGSRLSYLVASGFVGEKLETLSPKNFGNDDVAQVVLIVTTGNQPVGVDVRWLDLRIRSVGVRGPAPPSAIRKGQSGVWLLGALVATLGASVVLGVIVLRRRRTKATTPDALSFACSGCGASLRAKAHMAGKTVTCPRCGVAVACTQAAT